MRTDWTDEHSAISIQLDEDMQNSPRKPPEKLEDALLEFRDFLRKLGAPDDVRWTAPENVLWLGPERFLVRRRDVTANNRWAEQRYREGVKRGLGVALVAVCTTGQTTWATIFAPADEMAAQYALMPRGGLKLNCPTRIAKATVTASAIRWLWLKRQHNSYASTLL